MDQFNEFVRANPFLATALSSLWGAVVIDLMAFSKSKDPGPFLTTFSLKVAGLRYLQSFVGGLVGNLVVAAGAGAVAGVVIVLLT